MTDQTRETLTDVLERAMSMDDDVPIWAYNYRKTGAVAAALRDVLTPRTCGTCRHANTEDTLEGWCYCAAPAPPTALPKRCADCRERKRLANERR